MEHISTFVLSVGLIFFAAHFFTACLIYTQKTGISEKNINVYFLNLQVN